MKNEMMRQDRKLENLPAPARFVPFLVPVANILIAVGFLTVFWPLGDGAAQAPYRVKYFMIQLGFVAVALASFYCFRVLVIDFWTAVVVLPLVGSLLVGVEGVGKPFLTFGGPNSLPAGDILLLGVVVPIVQWSLLLMCATRGGFVDDR